jgi:hypothetical protein
MIEPICGVDGGGGLDGGGLIGSSTSGRSKGGLVVVGNLSSIRKGFAKRKDRINFSIIFFPHRVFQ